MRLILIFVLSLFYYRVTAQTNIADVESSLPGKWNWIKTELVSELNPKDQTPESCNCTRHIVFDKRNVKEYRNDSLIKTHSYYITDYNFMNDPVRVIFHSTFTVGEIKMFKDTIISGVGSANTKASLYPISSLNGKALSVIGIGPFGGCGAIEYFRKEK